MTKEASPDMHLPPVKKELNINSIIAVVGFALTIVVSVVGWSASAATFKASVDEMGRKYDGWIVLHEQLHKERNVEVSSAQARTDQRIATLEADFRKVDNIEYRLTVQEQGTASLARSVEELKGLVNNQGTDLKVIREILTRLDPASR